MKPIRFRGKDLYRGVWVYGYFKQHGDLCYIEDDDGLATLVSSNTVCELAYISESGKEVYEGDYVTFHEMLSDRDEYYLVAYNEELQAFRAMPQGDSMGYIEVGFPDPVGNMFDDDIEELMRRQE